LRENLRAQNAISEQLFVDTQNDESRARPEHETARDKLGLLGLEAIAIDRVPQEEGDENARLTLRAPVDGTALEVGAEPGNFYDQ
jgi:hypothetical protein